MLLLIFVGVLWAKCSLQGISVTEWQRKDHQGRRSSLCYAVILFVWWSASLSEWIRAGYVTATCSMLPRTGWEIVGINSCAYPIWIVLILLSLGISDACLQTLYPVVRRAGRWSTLMAARHRVCTNLLSEIFPLNEIRVNGLIAKNAYLTKVRTCWLKFRWLNLLWSWAKHEIQVRQLKGMMNWWYTGAWDAAQPGVTDSLSPVEKDRKRNILTRLFSPNVIGARHLRGVAEDVDGLLTRHGESHKSGKLL
jgi:hypothetical protein